MRHIKKMKSESFEISIRYHFCRSIGGPTIILNRLSSSLHHLNTVSSPIQESYESDPLEENENESTIGPNVKKSQNFTQKSNLYLKPAKSGGLVRYVDHISKANKLSKCRSWLH